MDAEFINIIVSCKCFLSFLFRSISHTSGLYFNLNLRTHLVGTSPKTEVSTEMVVTELQFYQEIWFIALAVVLGVLVLLILLACCIRNCGKSNPYIRERLPLQARRGKQPLSFVIDANDGSFSSSVSCL